MCKSSPYRECLHCGTSFEPYRSNSKYCSKKCGMVYWRSENAEKLREQAFNKYHDNNEAIRAKRFEAKYGITVEQRDAMYADQEGKCLVCEQHMTWDHRKGNTVHVDHCHTSGEVKGLLCSKCNTAAGLLGENPKIAASLVQYLLDTAKVPTR